MNRVVKLLDLFKTSIGEIAILAFSGEDMPSVGMILKNKSNFKWKIAGIGANRKLSQTNNYTGYQAESIWDCTLKPLGHSEPIEGNDTLEIEQ